MKDILTSFSTTRWIFFHQSSLKTDLETDLDTDLVTDILGCCFSPFEKATFQVPLMIPKESLKKISERSSASQAPTLLNWSLSKKWVWKDLSSANRRLQLLRSSWVVLPVLNCWAPRGLTSFISFTKYLTWQSFSESWNLCFQNKSCFRYNFATANKSNEIEVNFNFSTDFYKPAFYQEKWPRLTNFTRLYGSYRKRKCCSRSAPFKNQRQGEVFFPRKKISTKTHIVWPNGMAGKYTLFQVSNWLHQSYLDYTCFSNKKRLKISENEKKSRQSHENRAEEEAHTQQVQFQFFHGLFLLPELGPLSRQASKSFSRNGLSLARKVIFVYGLVVHMFLVNFQLSFRFVK